MILGQPVTVKPTQGSYLRKPNGQVLSPDGETVTATSYWLRRLDDGDIIEVDAQQPQAVAVQKAAAESTKTKG